MGLFSRKKEVRSQNDAVVNPCPPDDQKGNSMSLSNLLKLSKSSDPMSLSPFYSGVNIISNSVALMGWKYKDNEDNELKPTHYLWHLFDNSKLTRFNIVKNVIEDVIIHGNGFLYIERDNETGKPITLHYSPANETIMYYNPLSNELFYTNPTFTQRWDNGDNFLHFFMQPDTTGFKGAGVPSFAYKTISLANSMEKSANDYFENGLQLFGIISTNTSTPFVGTMDETMKTLRSSWDEARKQSKGTGTIFVPADLKYTPLSANAKDSALLESRLYSITDVARFLNISPVLLGDLSHTQYGSIAESQKEFIIHTLMPYVKMIEEQCDKKLIMPSKHCLEHVDLDENAILAVDLEKQANYYHTLVSCGIMSINESRHALGLPPVDGGDNLVIPYTDISQNTIGNTEGKTDEKSEQDEQIETDKNNLQ